ncbi:MAG: FmdE family protein, partial [Polyangiaceae bacterium]
MKLTGLVLLVSSSILVGCGSPPMVPPSATAPASSADDEALDRVIAIHGGAGPWVVAGYRMGLYAELGLPRGSFDLVVTHFAPQKVQYSCIADGAAAATGASMGRLNLIFADATAADTH